MAYSPTTDFLALWRLVAGEMRPAQMPGLDFVVSALDRAGLLNVVISGTQPVSNQATTAWFSTAIPSDSAEGILYLWDSVAGAYGFATPALFLDLLQASAGQSGVSWWPSLGGPPANTVGNNGDFAIRLDGVGGIYGPKAAGAWPPTPIPGSTNTIDQSALDVTFGAAPGSIIYRGATEWEALTPGAANTLLTVQGDLPAWLALSALLDSVFSSEQGAILFRDAAAWAALPPGADGTTLSSNGPAANPSWEPRATEFPSGTRMLFQQSNAPPGWTKDVSTNDVGLRVVNDVVGSQSGAAFSAVFSQTEVGDTELTVDQIPEHAHAYVNGTTVSGATSGQIALAGIYPSGQGATNSAGGGEAHTHSVTLNLAYVDVIMAQKD